MRRHKQNRFRKFELLEDRRMKAGDIDFDSDTGVLSINGDSHNDQAYISFEGDEVHVKLDVRDSDGDIEDHKEEDVDISNVSTIVFNGFAGNDTVQVDVHTLDSGVTLNYLGFEFHGGDDNDTLTQTGGGVFTWAYGENGNDSLQGSSVGDLLEGGAGDDSLEGGGGSDYYTFAGSNLGTDEVREAANVDNGDTLGFTQFNQGVTVDLANVYSTNQQYAVNSTDLKLKLSTSTGIENVYGSAFNDVIKGNARENYLNGGDGLDRLEGRGGNDSLSGGKNSDTYVFAGSNLGTDSIGEGANADNDALDFSGMTHGLRVDLSKAGAANPAVNNADLKLTLSNDTAIETIFGTDFEDVLLGNSRDNYLYGRGGQDSIQGRAGVDELHGGADDDILYVDSLDHAYGETGWDYFNGIKETTNPSDNPSPDRYMDWGRIFWAQL
jgi:Ca2+-binding RTX toxin-like protein